MEFSNTVCSKHGLSLLLVAFAQLACAQHLWWRAPEKQAQYTAIYGEIRVLATSPTIYFCGCNWHPGEPAGGYTGIQDQGNGRHNMIFSIWDTSPTLHPRTIQADPLAKYNRFGGEGTGAHTHLDYNWPIQKVYRYFAKKTQAADGLSTLTSVYFYDEGQRGWVHEATISNPNGDFGSVKTFGGGMNAFLENWSGQERSAPKLALYRLWVGTSASDLHCVTKGSGDGKWGVLDNSFYLAEGDDAALAPLMGTYATHGGPPRPGQKKGEELEIPDRPVPARILEQLNHLPSAPPASDQGGSSGKSLIPCS